MNTRAFLLFCFIFLSGLSNAQPPDVRNLGFEYPGIAYNPVYPWTKTYYSKPRYRIIRDSSVSHSGQYSLRITYDTVSKDISAGTIYNSIPLDVIGKTLRFSAYFKQSNPNIYTGLVSCVVSQDIGEHKVTARGCPIGKGNEWTLCSREISLDSFNLPIDHLRLNVSTDTKDTIWIDDIKIEVDGKDTYSVPSFASGKNEIIKPLTSQQITNLEMLCKIWGFLKYFHPAVASGKFNWDMELFKTIPQVSAAKDNTTFNNIFFSWFKNLGFDPVCDNCDYSLSDDLILYNLDMEWMETNILQDSVKKKLEFILDHRHTGNGYYAQYRPLKNLEFPNELSYHDWRDINFPNLNFRLQFLFRYWNTIQYFYPYKNIIGKDWNEVLRQFIPRFAEAKDLISYHKAIAELINSINDSHSGYWDLLLRKELVPFVFPAKVTIINDRAVINAFTNDSLAKTNGLMLGDEIETINGRPVKEIINEFMPLINGSNYTVKLAYLCSNDYITGGKDSVINITILRNDKPLSLTINRYRFIPTTVKKDPARWKIINNNIGYVNMGLLERKDVDSMFLDMSTTKAIIFDLRNYPNSTVYDICKYLYTEQKSFARIIYPNLNYPGTFIPKTAELYGPDKPNYPHYSGKIVVLVNENTQSQAEWTTMAFQKVQGAITIGSQTSGADGDVSYLYMTGDYMTKMSGLGVFYLDGTPTQQTGVKIDIVVHPTVKGIREGRDEVLEKALQVIMVK